MINKYLVINIIISAHCILASRDDDDSDPAVIKH